MSKDQTLVIYHGGFNQDASTISEHVRSFLNYIDTPVIALDAALIYSHKYLKLIEKKNVTHIILHYSLFGYMPFSIRKELETYLIKSNAKKIAFFQDENQSCKERFKIVDNYKVETVFTILEKKYHKEVYLDNTSCKSVYSTLTGYVDDNLIKLAEKYKKKYEDRSCDVGYRARPLPIYLGLGGQEKTDIAKKFIQHAKDTNLAMDIQTSEESRLYGEDWNKFLGNCRCMLGVESGTTIFDIDGTIMAQMNLFIHENPTASDNDLHVNILKDHENKIYYRAISPRIFESAIYRNLMILFEGKYQSIVEPGKHYIELKKDFSNIDEVIEKAQDPFVYQRITDRAYNDLILSGKYSYRLFVEDFCKKVGIKSVDKKNENEVTYYPSISMVFCYKIYSKMASFLKFNFIGRNFLRQIMRRILGIN